MTEWERFIRTKAAGKALDPWLRRELALLDAQEADRRSRTAAQEADRRHVVAADEPNPTGPSVLPSSPRAERPKAAPAKRKSRQR